PQCERDAKLAREDTRRLSVLAKGAADDNPRENLARLPQRAEPVHDGGSGSGGETALLPLPVRVLQPHGVPPSACITGPTRPVPLRMAPGRARRRRDSE